MPLETATSISQLVASNPAHTDGLNQADAHMRLIKSVLQAQFPGFVSTGSAALASSQTQLDAAVASAVAKTAPLAVQAGTAGAPAITFGSDATTGLYASGTGRVTFSVSGTPVSEFSATGLSVPNLTLNGNVTGTANAAIIPIGGSCVWWGTSLPNSDAAHWAWCNGATIVGGVASFPTLAANCPGLVSGGNIILPNLCEAVPIGNSTMGGASARGLITSRVPNNANKSVLNALLGEADHLQLAAELATHTPTLTGAPSYTPGSAVTGNPFVATVTNGSGLALLGSTSGSVGGSVGIGTLAVNTITNSANMNVTQSSVVVNWIIRIA